MIAGIQRVVITPTPNNWRFKEAMRRWPMTYDLYRQVFADLNMPLLDGVEEIECSKDEAFGRLDRELGIDVILSWPNGMRACLQEKILLTTFDTATVEYMNDPRTGEKGDWFHLMPNYYLVAYSQKASLEFRRWVLLDWAALQRETLRGNIHWQIRPNQGGARSNFKFVPFEKIPQSCIIACSWLRAQLSLF